MTYKPYTLSVLTYIKRGNKLSGKSLAKRNFCLKNFLNENGGQQTHVTHPT